MKKRFMFWIFLMTLVFYLTPHSLSSPDSQKMPTLLVKDYDLSLKGKKGDIDYYRMKTVYYHGDELGVIQNKDELIGSFKREILETSQKSLVVRYTWKNLRTGYGAQPQEEITTWKPLSFTEGFSYELDLFDPEYFLSSIDIKNIPKTMEGMRFWVNIMDAHAQFELLRTEVHGSISQIKKIGDRVTSPGAHQTGGWDLPSFITDSKFTNGDYDTQFVGLSVVDGKTSAVLEYINSDSRLSSKIEMTPKLIFDQDGTSNFWGHIFVDLESGKLTRGDLYEYVVALIKGVPHLSSMRVFERRYIEIARITKDQFGSESPAKNHVEQGLQRNRRDYRQIDKQSKRAEGISQKKIFRAKGQITFCSAESLFVRPSPAENLLPGLCN